MWLCGLFSLVLYDESKRIFRFAWDNWQKLDTDGDGAVTWEEFETGMTKELGISTYNVQINILEKIYATIQDLYFANKTVDYSDFTEGMYDDHQ